MDKYWISCHFATLNVWSIVFLEAYLRKLTIYSGRIANRIPGTERGFGLAQETIDAIRQAETAAEAAEKEAVKEAEAIVAEAKAQAAQMKAEMTEICQRRRHGGRGGCQGSRASR